MFSKEKLERIAKAYRTLLSKATASEGAYRKFLFGIARRARKRLARIGVVLRDRPDGNVTFAPKLSRVTSHDADYVRAAEIVKFIQAEKLSYGNLIKASPSWAICLNTYNLSSEISDILTRVIPPLISEYAILSRRFLLAVLDGRDVPYGNVALFGVPDEVINLWRKAALHGPMFPYCYRPDLLITPSGEVIILEFNVDTRLDRGVAVGVSEYCQVSLPTAGLRFVGTGLAQAYASAARRLSGLDQLSAATVVNNSCRSEYFAQERFFCRRVSTNRGVDWQLLSTDDIGASLQRDRPRVSRGKFDILNLEMEILDGPWKHRPEEVRFIDGILARSDLNLLGTVLPFADKLLFSTVGQGGDASTGLKSILCRTMLLDDERHQSAIASGRSGLDDHYVLKRTGIFRDTTGSKGVIISSDVPRDQWEGALENALSDMRSGSSGWVLQPRMTPQKYAVRYRYSLNGATRQDDCFIRLSAYYTQTNAMLSASKEAESPRYALAGAVATAGTDEETLRKTLFTIRGLRQSTYMGVTTNA